MSTACAADLALQNPIATSALLGLQAYLPLYRASCLKDSDTGAYCYATAVTNTTTSGGDTYPYYLPLGMQLPGGTALTCSACLQETMAIFEAAAGNRSLVLSETYAPAAAQVDVFCGVGFVNASIPVAETATGDAAASMAPYSGLVSLLALGMMVFSLL